MGRKLPARFLAKRRDVAPAPEPAEQKADQVLWEVLDKVSSDQMLADSEQISALERERDQIQYQIDVLNIMIAKSYQNSIMAMDREMFFDRKHKYEEQLTKLDMALAWKGQRKWGWK